MLVQGELGRNNAGSHAPRASSSSSSGSSQARAPQRHAWDSWQLLFYGGETALQSSHAFEWVDSGSLDDGSEWSFENKRFGAIGVGGFARDNSRKRL